MRIIFIFYLLSFVLIFHLTGDVKKPNVLIISVDDMNDWVGCMGHQQALTPNIDRLAEEGMLFLDAHVAAPVCNPSRVSFYTGLHPFNSKVYENGDHMRVKNPDVITMPQYFRSHGYKADAGGKTFHDVSSHHDVMSFDSYYWWHPSGEKGSPNHGSPYSVEPDPEPIPRPHAGIAKFTKRNFDWASLDENDRPLTHWPDYKVASWACDYLKKDHDKPFFLNVGIFRPHIPWYNPKKYVEMYPLDKIQLPPIKDDDLNDLGVFARERALDRSSKHALVKEKGLWKKAIQAYLASISFADDQVGRVLKTLRESRYAKNTIVVFWSDHGYHLGEKGHWHKRTLWERSTNIPLIIKAPGVTKEGTRFNLPVNAVDIYPTLLDLCGLPKKEDLDGENLITWIDKPNQEKRTHSLTTWKKGNHAITTKYFRYIRYHNDEEELYHKINDPDEWNNLVKQKEFKKELEKHRKLLIESTP